MNELAAILETHNWFDYAGFYDRMAARSDFRVFVEVGCWKGHSLRHLARQLKARGDDVIVYGVDLWDISYLKENAPEEFNNDPDYLYQVYNANIVEAGVREIVRDVRACSWESADRFENGAVDFVFIDADHSYESVVRDLRAWLPKVRTGGVISGHDYFNYSSVRRAVDEIFGDAIEIDGSIWLVDTSRRPAESQEARKNERLAWLERQREAWIRATDERQAIILEKTKALEWTDQQWHNWQRLAEQAEERERAARGYLDWTEDQRKNYEELMLSWRKVAEEREQTIIELERVNGLLEAAQKPLIEKCRRLELAEREASLALAELRRSIEAAPQPIPAPAAEPNLKARLKALFPRESLHGRVARKLARMVRDPAPSDNGRG